MRRVSASYANSELEPWKIEFMPHLDHLNFNLLSYELRKLNTKSEENHGEYISCIESISSGKYDTMLQD